MISILSITGFTAYVVAVTMTPTSVGSIVDDGTTLLTNPRTVEVVDIAGQLIAIVTSRGDNGIEIIDVSDPDEPTSLSNCADGDGTQSCGATNLADPWGVATYTKDGSTYAVVTSNDDKSIEIIDVTTPASPESVGRVQDTIYLNLATFLKITTIGDSTYAVVASSGTKTTSSHVTMVDITDPANPQVGGSLTDTASILLKGPKSIDVYTVGDSTYAVVAAQEDDGIVIVDISDPNALTSVASFGDTDSSCSDDGGHSDGNCELNGATGLEIFSIGSSTYVVVTSRADNGVQIIDITTPSSPDAVGQVEDDGDTILHNPRGVDVFSIGTSTYALVSNCGGGGCEGGGIEVLDISDPTAPTTVGEDGARLANDNILGASYSTVYTLSNSTGKYVYAITLGYENDTVEIIHLGSEPTVTITSSSGSSGDTINSTVFSYTVTFSLTTSDFTIEDITVTGTANAGSPEASNFAGSGTTYTFDVVVSSSGTVSVSVPAGKATHTTTGHDNTASNTYTLTTQDKGSSTCARLVILGNCGTIAINNDEYQIIDPWSTVPTTEVMVGEPASITISTPHNFAAGKINSVSVYTEIFGSAANYELGSHIDYSIMKSDYYVSESEFFQVAGATHRIVQDTDVKNLEMFEVVFTMVFAKPMDTSHIVVETKNMHGISETIYLGNALKVIERPIELLTYEEKSKFELISEPELKDISSLDMDIEPDMDMLSIDPEPVVSKVTCGNGTMLKDNLCVANEMSFYFFINQFMVLFG
uniref:LVIVD repeat-containing protein n=1 Tax=uncultured marine thaumarchaeote KM3_175_E04 TaxID=1456054 RepID=A0A075GND3_9ARCH|nr:LVIVD repeat-containing protein [uncultured marine thaumarchaeote KM3_175_E04]